MLVRVGRHPRPETMQFYCLDFGGGALSALRPAACRAVAGRRDAELFAAPSPNCSAAAATGGGVSAARRRLDGRLPQAREADLAAPMTRTATCSSSSMDGQPASGIRRAGDRDHRARGPGPVVRNTCRVDRVTVGGDSAAVKDQIGTRIELRLGDPGNPRWTDARARQVGAGATGPRPDPLTAASSLIAVTASRTAASCARSGVARRAAGRLLPASCRPRAPLVSSPATPGAGGHRSRRGRTGAVAMDFAEKQHVLVLGECGVWQDRGAADDLRGDGAQLSAAAGAIDDRRLPADAARCRRDRSPGRLYAVAGGSDAAVPALVEGWQRGFPDRRSTSESCGRGRGGRVRRSTWSSTTTTS